MLLKLNDLENSMVNLLNAKIDCTTVCAGCLETNTPRTYGFEVILNGGELVDFYYLTEESRNRDCERVLEILGQENIFTLLMDE